ncbi:hypothetical protein V1227_19060 [Lentzea sp. DG1S-22]|uniref:hypothetical protein n=1 Tax=unclassified Lentzea TaxID=2643253 RepID=UPI00224AA53A|nr:MULTISPECIES: hypothetical protein [unclassified Lentzea]MCX2949963.1 hypothetical protein [Lentzea sp. NEAU-D7]WVH84748.1 hypothetical protein V1227_19060 [Lentzea sp. DG1S-22]
MTSQDFAHGQLALVIRYGEEDGELALFVDDGEDVGHWQFFGDEVVDYPEDVTVVQRVEVVPA